jgi:hypothetical protein
MSEGNVVALRPKERVKQDAEPIATIYRNLGATSAEQVVTRALTELALTMAGLASQIRNHDLGDVDRQLRRLQRMSENLGMISLSLIAGDVRYCLKAGNTTAFASVWARLLRVAERSLAADREMLGQTQI